MAPSCHSTVKYDYETHKSPARIGRRSKARDLAGLSAACGRTFGNTDSGAARRYVYVWADGVYLQAQRGAARLTTHGAGYANIQAPYPTTRSREPAVSPELHNESRRALKAWRLASISGPATARQPHAWLGPRLAQSPCSIAAAVAKSRRRAVS